MPTKAPAAPKTSVAPSPMAAQGAAIPARAPETLSEPNPLKTAGGEATPSVKAGDAPKAAAVPVEETASRETPVTPKDKEANASSKLPDPPEVNTSSQLPDGPAEATVNTSSKPAASPKVKASSKSAATPEMNASSKSIADPKVNASIPSQSPGSGEVNASSKHPAGPGVNASSKTAVSKTAVSKTPVNSMKGTATHEETREDDATSQAEVWNASTPSVGSKGADLGETSQVNKSDHVSVKRYVADDHRATSGTSSRSIQAHPSNSSEEPAAENSTSGGLFDGLSFKKLGNALSGIMGGASDLAEDASGLAGDAADYAGEVLPLPNRTVLPDNTTAEQALNASGSLFDELSFHKIGDALSGVVEGAPFVPWTLLEAGRSRM